MLGTLRPTPKVEAPPSREPCQRGTGPHGGMVSLPQGVMPWQSSLFKSGYSTTKSVRIYSWRVILVYYGLCLTVAVYVLIYMMFWHRGTWRPPEPARGAGARRVLTGHVNARACVPGYQKVDQLMGTVHTKLKGSANDAANLDAALAVRPRRAAGAARAQSVRCARARA